MLEREHKTAITLSEETSINAELEDLEASFIGLQEARVSSRPVEQYKNNTSTFLKTFEADSLIMEICSTQLHLKLLWGSKDGKQANKNRSDRYYKFSKVLAVLSERVEPCIPTANSI